MTRPRVPHLHVPMALVILLAHGPIAAAQIVVPWGDIVIVQKETAEAKQVRLAWIREERDRIAAEQLEHLQELEDLREIVPEAPREPRLSEAERRQRETQELLFSRWMGIENPKVRFAVNRGAGLNSLITVLGPIANRRRAFNSGQVNEAGYFPSLSEDHRISLADIEHLKFENAFSGSQKAVFRLNHSALELEWPPILLARWPRDCEAVEILQSEYVRLLSTPEAVRQAQHLAAYDLLEKRLELLHAHINTAKRSAQDDPRLTPVKRGEVWTELAAAERDVERLRATARRYRVAPSEFKQRRFQGQTVEDLIDYIYTEGLRITEAAPDDEATYFKIFRQLQAYARDIVLIENRKDELVRRINALETQDQLLLWEGALE